MDALLGVAFVAQWPSAEAKTYFVHPREGKRAPKEHAAEGQAKGDPAPAAQPLHIRENTVEWCFGVPGVEFAKLMLPGVGREGIIYNNPLFAELDAGHRLLSHGQKHGEHAHLQLVSFPCYIEAFNGSDIRRKWWRLAAGQAEAKVEAGASHCGSDSSPGSPPSAEAPPTPTAQCVAEGSKASHEALVRVASHEAFKTRLAKPALYTSDEVEVVDNKGFGVGDEIYFGADPSRATRYKVVRTSTGLKGLTWLDKPLSSSWLEGDLVTVSQKAEAVDKFNIVLILNARAADRSEHNSTATLWQIAAHLSRGLVSEENRAKYLSNEIKRLATRQPSHEQKAMTLEEENGMQLMTSQESELPPPTGSLERLLVDMYNGVVQHGYAVLTINGMIRCQVSVYPKHEAPPPPSEEHALALLCPREQLMLELPPDSADVVRKVVEHTGPTVSLGDLVENCALPLSTFQRAAQHLVYWKKARVVDRYANDTYVTVAKGIDTRQGSEACKRYDAWQEEEQRVKIKPPELTFQEIIAHFAEGRTLGKIREEFRVNCTNAQFDKIFERLVAEDVLVQLGKFYFFHADTAPDTSDAGLTESEIALLTGRGGSHLGQQFLHNFATFFAKPHRRIDNCLRWAHPLKKEEALALLEKNKDIFVPYTCWT